MEKRPLICCFFLFLIYNIFNYYKFIFQKMDQNTRLIQNSSSLNKYLISLLSNFDKNKEKDLEGWLSKVE
jgi:hypothetical protein